MKNRMIIELHSTSTPHHLDIICMILYNTRSNACEVKLYLCLNYSQNYFHAADFSNKCEYFNKLFHLWILMEMDVYVNVGDV